ncbi:MAG: hypothetical protein WDO56_26850 [Gammaproteobacteria bacterium]
MSGSTPSVRAQKGSALAARVAHIRQASANRKPDRTTARALGERLMAANERELTAD